MTPRTGRHITVRASRGISEYLSPSLGTECGRAKMPDWSRLHQPTARHSQSDIGAVVAITVIWRSRRNPSKPTSSFVALIAHERLL